MNQGKLPLSCWKKRKTEDEELKRSRLEEAVIACKGGKMSQAAASMMYRIPKTTIWRRMQQDAKKMEKMSNTKKQKRLVSIPQQETRTQESAAFTYCEVT